MSDAAIIAWVVLAFTAGVAGGLALRRKHRRPGAAREHLEMASASLPMLFWEAESATGRIDWIGDSAAVFGAPVPDLAQLRALFGEADRAAFAAAVEARETPPAGLELRLGDTEGGERWVRCHWQALPGGREGRLVGVCLDVDAQRRAVRLLGEQRAEYQTILDSSPALIWFKDRDDRILRVNRSAAAARGLPVEAIEGRPTAEIYPDDAARYRADDLEVIRSGRPKLGIVEPLMSEGGARRWLRTDKIPLRDAHGGLAGVVVFALDITDQKEAEEKLAAALGSAERESRAKSEFLSAMSHEIRTPLGVIMGFAELLNAPAIETPTRLAYSDKILRNGRRLMKLIDEILDLSKVERGRLQLEAVELSLAALLADVSSLLSQKARAKGITFEIHTLGEIPERVVSDPSRIRQVLINVIDNAIKFTETGGVHVTVEATAPAMLAIVVRDTGIGMAPDAVAHLFQPFAQGEAATARRFGGSGLGLSLARRLAQALGGDIVLEATAPGQGSTFRITLRTPLAGNGAADRTTFSYQVRREVEGMPPASGLAPPAARATAGGGVWDHVRLLLVEDNPDIQDMIRMYLEPTGATLLVASNGQEGIERALAGVDPPDVVLMDLQLPGVDGMRATAELRARGFRKPIVAMTAHAMKGQRQICLEAGFDDFLTKPLSKDDLLRKLAAWAPAGVG